MRFIIPTLLVLISCFANAASYSDLTASEQVGIKVGLQKFLPVYKNAIDIAVHNIEKNFEVMTEENAPMGTLSNEKTSARQIFVKVEQIFSGNESMTGFARARGSQSMRGVQNESHRAEMLVVHVSHEESPTAWMKEMNSQLQVVSTGNGVATVRLVNFSRGNCEILADSTSQVLQVCNQ